MRSGVCFPSSASEATWTGTAFDADFPVTNLSDLVNIRRVAARTTTAAFSVDFVFPTARSIDFVAAVHHNAGPAATLTIQLSSGTDPTTNIVYSGTANLLRRTTDGDATFARVTPLALVAPLSVRSGRLTFSANDVPMEIGGIEIGQFWSWYDVNVPREIGVESTAEVIPVGGGAEHAMMQWAPRTIAGTREVVDQSELDTKLLDFQRTNGTWAPFVWCWDAADPTTWAREAVLVRNRTLPAGAMTESLSGRMAFAFLEHLA